MGEYADMAVDEALNANFDYDEDFDEGGWLGRPRRKRKLPTCKYCGQPNLVWKEHNGGWRLFDLKIEDDDEEWILHSCLTEGKKNEGSFE